MLNMRKSNRGTLQAQEARLGYLLIAPAFLLVAMIIFYPVAYNIWLSFHDVSLNPNKPDIFIGLENYKALLVDSEFWHSVMITLIFTVVTVAGATVVGLGTALLLNRSFPGRKLVRSIILLPYVAPVISLVFVWQYMFNPVYGMVNYTLVEQLGVFKQSIDWLDNPVGAIWLVILFDIWHLFPFSFMMILAKLQAIDSTLYEAAEIDGASGWQKFRYITLPELQFVLGALVILRFIWNFYKFDEIYLLTKEVPVVSVYAYETAFATYDHGRAAAITAMLFVLIMILVVAAVRRVLKW
ncbi:binding-protein-dependent transport systems inner membrane component [Parageobacillus genomosp. 1]|uniref:Binding-protein-dependent transport systems inner membrane component n=2 Tax=Parageobacillus genomosp. 1 TaxID=1295642 RepID=A0ABC9VFI9_9BACL|nr:binding-protein-dependent transport systems inner membrane component [Parageobacillus genomosp. 1]